jgi:hypothetical protein
VLVNGDNKVEANETFTVSMNTVSNANVNITDTAIGTITNDDTSSVTIADVTLAEGNAGTTTFTFTATLGNAVQGGFTVNYATADGTATTADNDYNAASGTLTFVGTAGETQTFNVLVNGDNKVEANETFTVSMNTVSNANVNITDTAIGTITNDDTAGVTVNPTIGLVTTEAGGTATFTIVLTSEPTANVTITLASTDTSEGTVSPTSVTFTPANWNVAQTVTVTGVDDAIADGNIAYTITTTMTVGGDAIYNAIDPADVSVTNNDDDTAGVTVNPTIGLVTTEAGGTATFTIVLTSEPTANVTITLASTDTSEGTVSPTSVTFTPANWNVAQTVTVTGVDDAIADGNIAYTITTTMTVGGDAIYNAIDPADVSVTNNDDDVAGITVSPTTVSIAEGGATATFNVNANTAPTADVTIALTTDAQCNVLPTSVTLTAGNTTAVSVTVTAVDDVAVEGNHTCAITTGDPTSADTFYNVLGAGDVADVTANVADNDAQFAIASDQANVNEGTASSNSFSFTVTRTGANQLPASVDLGYGGATLGIDFEFASVNAGSLTGNTLSFPANTASITVSYNTIPNAVDQADRTLTVTLSNPMISGTGSLGTSTANTVILDDDTAGVTVNPTIGLVTTEAGGTATFTIVLTSEPTANVTITLASTDTSEGTVSPTSVTFTPANWNVAQTVTVTGVDDAIADGNIAYTITTTMTVGGDATYNAIDPADVSVTNNDDDTPGITANPNAGLVTTEAGGTATFSVTLNSQPNADVVLSVTSNNPTEGTVSPTTLTFTDADWNIPQTVTITGQDDFVPDGDIAYTITVALNSTTDTTGYAVVTDVIVNATNNDDDTPGVTITPLSGTVVEGGNVTYNVVLNTLPAADVVLTLSTLSTETTITTLPIALQLTFTPADWNVPQTVTLTVADNALLDGTRTALITHTFASADMDYNALPDVDYTLTIFDNETPPTTEAIGDGAPASPRLRVLGIAVAGTTSPLPRPNENATWEFVVRNESGAAVSDVVATITYPDDNMQGVSATSSTGVNGSFRKGSLIAEYALGTLGAGESVTLNLTTKLPNRAGVFVGTLTVTASGVQVEERAVLTLVSVTQLPSTGETPLWRNALIGALVALGLALLGVLGRRRRTA